MPGTFDVIPASQIHGPLMPDEESIQFKYSSSTPVYILTNGDTCIHRHDGAMIGAGKLTFLRGRRLPRSFISGQRLLQAR